MKLAFGASELVPVPTVLLRRIGYKIAGECCCEKMWLKAEMIRGVEIIAGRCPDHAPRFYRNGRQIALVQAAE